MAAKVLKKLSYPNQNQRNNYAKELRKTLYKQRVIKSKKVYNRKNKNESYFERA